MSKSSCMRFSIDMFETYTIPNIYMFLREKSNFSQKTSRKSWKGPCDPGSPGTSISYYSSCISERKSCSTSLPGGDQVDGLPPAASNTKYSCLETPGRLDLFVNFGGATRNHLWKKAQRKKTPTGSNAMPNLKPAVDRQPGHRRKDSTGLLLP